MLSLVNFEFKKFFNRRKNIITILIFILIVIGFIVINTITDIYTRKSQVALLEERIELVSKSLDKIKDELIESPKDIYLKQKQENVVEELQLMSSSKTSYKNKEWNSYIKSVIQLDNLKLDGKSYEGCVSGEQAYDIRKNVEKNTILLRKNITPISDKTSMQGYNFMKLFLNGHMMLIVAILLAVLCSDVISSEVYYSTYELLYTQAIDKKVVLFSKIISVTLISEIIVFSILGIFFVITGLINGFGNSNYPTEVLLNGNITFIPISTYITYTLIVLSLFIILISMLYTFISSICRSIKGSIIISIILTMIVYINREFILSHKININFKMGLIVICISILMILIFDCIAFDKVLCRDE